MTQIATTEGLVEFFAFNLYTNQIDYVGVSSEDEVQPEGYNPSIHIMLATRGQLDALVEVATSGADLGLANSRTGEIFTVKRAGFGYQTYDKIGQMVSPPPVIPVPSFLTHPKDLEHYRSLKVLPSSEHRLVDETISLIYRIPGVVVVGTHSQFMGNREAPENETVETYHHSIDLAVNERGLHLVTGMAMDTIRQSNLTLSKDLEGRRVRWLDRPEAGTIVVTPALIERPENMFFHGSSLSITVLRVIFLPNSDGKEEMLNAFNDALANKLVEMNLDPIGVE